MKKHAMNIACAIALFSGLVGLGAPDHAFAASAARDRVCSWERVNYSWGYEIYNVCETVTVNMQTLDAEVEITYTLISTVQYV
jgi:hypothetical protein